MNRRAWLPAGALLILIGASTLAGAQAAPPPDPAPQEILVMLPVAPPHFRASGSYGSGYDDRIGSLARGRVARDLAQEHGLAVVAEWPMPALGVACYLMRSDSPGRASAALRALSSDRRVAWAQAQQTFRSLAYSDPLYPLQPSAKSWHLAEIHALTTGRDVAVAVVDSGVELSHPDLKGRIGLSRNFVDASPYVAEKHGTAVAGIIAANADDGLGIAGIAPRARLMALRACWEAAGGATSCNSFTLAKALQFALSNNARIINLSLTGPRDRLLESLLDAAQTQDVAVVGARDPEAVDGGFPASHPGVIAVTADEGDATGPIVRAPGRDVPATLPGGRWGFVSGTSFAAAQVSGVLALMDELRPDMRPSEAHERLLEAAVVIGADPVAGGARPARTDVCAVISRLARACACQCTTLARAVGTGYR